MNPTPARPTPTASRKPLTSADSPSIPDRTISHGPSVTAPADAQPTAQPVGHIHTTTPRPVPSHQSTPQPADTPPTTQTLKHTHTTTPRPDQSAPQPADTPPATQSLGHIHTTTPRSMANHQNTPQPADTPPTTQTLERTRSTTPQPMASRRNPAQPADAPSSPRAAPTAAPTAASAASPSADGGGATSPAGAAVLVTHPPPPKSPLVGVLLATIVLLAGVFGLNQGTATGSSWPLAIGPVEHFHWPLVAPHPVLRGFQPPSTPYGPGHRGVDLGGRLGEQVLAAGSGLVLYAGPLADRSLVSIEHAGGLRTTYEPVQPTVRVGQYVQRGQVIGVLMAGHRGCPAVAPTVCLHWGAHRDRVYLDPLRLVESGHVRLLPWPIGVP